MSTNEHSPTSTQSDERQPEQANTIGGVDRYSSGQSTGGRHESDSSRRARWRQRARRRLTAFAAKSSFIVVSLVGILAFTVLTPLVNAPAVLQPEGMLRLFAYTLLASFPTWLYVRFLGVKLDAVYQEYVLNLHRLAPDQAWNLPEPPYWSEYHKAWLEGREAQTLKGQAHLSSQENVYDSKFRAYFGRKPDPSHPDDPRVGRGSLLPVFVLWAAFSVGWLSVLLDPGFAVATVTGGSDTLANVLRFAFLGAYVFSVQVLVRGYFQNDLRSSTYVGGLERLAVVLILVTVINVVWGLLPSGEASYALEAGFAFIVGSFPILGQQWLNKVILGRMRMKLSLTSRHPLDEIDGMNVWYQARLLEEGIEDTQNLATANLVDVVLHSRAPVGRLVDWADQALLLQHLPPWGDPDNPDHPKKAETQTAASDGALRDAVHALGVRSASDLLELYAPLTSEAAEELHHRVRTIGPEGLPTKDDFRNSMLAFVKEDQRQGLNQRLLALLRSLGSEPNLQLVLNWQSGMADYQSTNVPGDQNPSSPVSSPRDLSGLQPGK